MLGVEAAEGTDKLIERCAEYRKSDGAAVLVKMIKPNQDERIDVPVIGVETVISAHKAKMAGIAIQKGKVIVLDPKNLVETADKYGIFVTTI